MKDKSKNIVVTGITLKGQLLILDAVLREEKNADARALWKQARMHALRGDEVAMERCKDAAKPLSSQYRWHNADEFGLAGWRYDFGPIDWAARAKAREAGQSND